MAGRMGGERITAQNLRVVRIDTGLDLIYVKGCIPGVDDVHVMVRDAKKKVVFRARAGWDKGIDNLLPRGVEGLPFPAGTKEMAEQEGMPRIMEAPSDRVTSPFLPKE